MRDYINIGPAPAEEDCAQVGQDNFYERARAEGRAFINLIRRTLGDEPDGALLKLKGFPHDFGTYYEVVCYYEEDNRAAFEYALRCEAEAPYRWDDEARQELKAAGFPVNADI